MSTLTPTPTLTIPSSYNLDSPTTSSPRRLSQTLTDIVTGVSPTRTRSASASSPRSPSPTSLERSTGTIAIDFEGGAQTIIRPNRLIRGSVILNITKPIEATRIRIKFRAEEVATAKVREFGLESKIERIDQVTTTHFDVETKVWGAESSAYLMSIWETIEPGEHQYPFALKFPNVNFPPSTDEPAGFSFHYIWTAYLDGPAFHPGMRSKEYLLPYRPIICAPPPTEWRFTQTVQSDKKTLVANVTVVLPRRSFCPDEDVLMYLNIESIPSDLIVSGLYYAFNKCNAGQIQLQRGIARKSRVRKILNSIVAVPGNDGSIRVPVNFHIPTRLVSPSFQSQNLCVYYELVFTIQFSNVGSGLLKSSSQCAEFRVPIGVTNLPNNHLLHIPNLTSVQSYLASKEPPVFFDPILDEPPSQMDDLSNQPLEWWAPLATALTTPPVAPADTSNNSNTIHIPSSPPNYFSLPNLPSQFIQKDREVHTVFSSRLIKPGMEQDLGDPITFVTEHKDYTW